MCKKIKYLSEPENVECETKESGVEYIEVHNSFTPSICVAFSAQKLKQVEVLSEEDDDHVEVVGTCKTARTLDNGGTNAVIETHDNTNDNDENQDHSLVGLDEEAQLEETSRIREVWNFNLDEEIWNICQVVKDFPFIAMDTEFPGVVAKPTGEFASIDELMYKTIK